ncbi:MAG: ATP-binding protein [bacterium]|nr:ATP-binding protein [bacterium]
MTLLHKLQDTHHVPLGENPWQQVIETCADIAYILSPSGDFLCVNPRLCMLFQSPREAILGTNLFDYLDDDNVATAKRILKEILAGKRPERSTRIVRFAEGRRAVFEVMEHPLVQGGDAWAVAGIGRDITQEAVLEQKLWDASESRRTAVDFALRTSLGLIKGYVYTLRRLRDLSETQHARYTQIIEEEVEHLGRIVENILDVRRLENATLEIESDVMPLRTVIEASVAHCADEASRRNAVISLSVPEAMPPMYLPRDAVERVLINLIQNGLHHSPQGGTIEVVAEDHEAYVDITVRDSGVGIPDSELSQIFDKYYRGAGSAAAGTQGAGMGLPVVRLLLEAMGGKISVQSRVGKGSAFRITLPRRPMDMGHMQSAESWAATADSQ